MPGLPVDQAAALLIEVVGLPATVSAQIEQIRELAAARRVGTVRVAADDAERALLWKGRKSAFGAIARIKPNYYLHDTVVPRHKLPEVLAQVYDIARRHELLVLNVFHAGDGNLHPLLVYDAREPGVSERVHAAGDEIVRVSVAAGGVLSGEHGIGLEKRDLMPLMFSEVDLAAQGDLAPGVRSRAAVEPRQGPPEPGDVRRRAQRSRRRMGVSTGLEANVAAFADDVGDSGPVSVAGLGTRGGAVDGVRTVAAPVGIEWIEPAEMTMRCGAGTPVAEVDAALAEHGQCVAMPPTGTVGGALAVGHSGLRRLGWGPVRDTLLQVRYVSAAGEVVKAGGPTVKNVSGFDLCRLIVGSRGTLGFIGDVILRTRPLPRSERWFSSAADPWELLAGLYRPTSVLWDGTTTWVLLDGHDDDVTEQAVGSGSSRQPVHLRCRRIGGRCRRRRCTSFPASDGAVRRRDRRRRRPPRPSGAGALGRPGRGVA